MAFSRSEFLRLIKMHQAFVTGRHPSLATLAALCDVHPRTVKRDIRMMREEFQAPVVFMREKGGYGYSRPFSFAPASFSEKEMLAVSIALEIADTFRNSPFVPALKGALHQLQRMFPEATSALSAEIPSMLTCLTDPAPQESVAALMHYNELLGAIAAHRQVMLTYHALSSGEDSCRTVDPYHLYYYRGMWYLLGWCHLRHTLRDFAVNRIQQLTILSATFPPPDLQLIRDNLTQRFTNIEDTPQEIVIRFDHTATPWIAEKMWHPSQTLTHHPDGSCTITMVVTGLRSIKAWVLGFGHQACVLAPESLRLQIQNEIASMAKKYE